MKNIKEKFTEAIDRVIAMLENASPIIQLILSFAFFPILARFMVLFKSKNLKKVSKVVTYAAISLAASAGADYIAEKSTRYLIDCFDGIKDIINATDTAKEIVNISDVKTDAVKEEE